MTDNGTGGVPPGGIGRGGIGSGGVADSGMVSPHAGTDVELAGLHEVGTGLGTLAQTLGDALHAVDTVPLDALRPVLGPVGGDFVAALLAATDRHRCVLSGVTDVAHAASELVLATERLYGSTDEQVAAALRQTGAGGAPTPSTEV